MTSSELTIGILGCATNRKEWLKQHGDFAEWFVPMLTNNSEKQLQFKFYQAHLGALPLSANDADAWLITGSPVSVYQNLPWQNALCEFVKTAIETHPVVGVCYGHQLLHQLLGGTVEKASKWGIGVHQYYVIETPDWVSKNDRVDTFRIIASHQDQVTKLAPNSRVLAKSEFCPVAISQIGERVLTIQPHPEITRDLARDLYAARRAEVGNELADWALGSIDGPIDDAVFTRWIFSFIDHVYTAENNHEMAAVS